jgi:hypothetical protein
VREGTFSNEPGDSRQEDASPDGECTAATPLTTFWHRPIFVVSHYLRK